MTMTVIGFEDESEQQQNIAIDFLLSIDASGSMGIIRQSVRDTICNWATQNTFQNSRFAIIVFGIGDYIVRI